MIGPILGIPVVVCNMHTIRAILVVSCMQASRTLQRILELVLRMNTIGPILRISVVCNMHTIRAILVVSSMQANRSLQRILELVLCLNTIGPILRVPVVCNMHTIWAIHVVCKRVAHFSVFWSWWSI